MDAVAGRKLAGRFLTRKERWNKFNCRVKRHKRVRKMVGGKAHRSMITGILPGLTYDSPVFGLRWKEFGFFNQGGVQSTWGQAGWGCLV